MKNIILAFIVLCVSISVPALLEADNFYVEQPPHRYLGAFKDIVGVPGAVSDLAYTINAEKAYGEYFHNKHNRLLLQGASGAGKTVLAHAFVHEIDVPLIRVKSMDLVDGYLDTGAVRQLFKEARDLKTPVVILIDYIEGIARKSTRVKERNPDVHDKTLVAFIQELDQCDNDPCNTVFVVVNAYNADGLDSALTKRFARATVKLARPTNDQCQQILDYYLNAYDHEPLLCIDRLRLKYAFWRHAVTGRDIKNIVTKARMFAHYGVITSKHVFKAIQERFA